MLCALLRLPTAAAAYELEEDDVVTGYGTISIGIIFSYDYGIYVERA